MRINLFTTNTNLDPVEINENDALIVNAGAFRVVVGPKDGKASLHVIDDNDGNTVFEWPT